jgi:pimeloyl-ACP methyl ester carboxylesterase
MPAMSRRAPHRHTAVLGLLVAVAVGCSSGSGVTTEQADPPAQDAADATADPPEEQGSIHWEPLDDRLATAVLEVPVDYDDPDGPTFELFLVRRRANDPDERIGSLLINPGGPGAGGAEFAAGADFVLDDELLDRFDVIGWDPRGTGYSSPAIDCIDDYDAYYAGYDITPDDEAERQEIIDLARDFAQQCVEKNEEIIQHVGTNNSARDIDAIREALGEETISYFGFSYGSELGATWATMFPETVRAAVLDGAADPTVGLTEGGIQQAAGFERTLATYLATCSADPDCAFHNDGDAEGAFDELMLELDEHPIPSEEGRPEITRGVALQAVAMAMYDDSLWNQLSEALADAQEGDGAGLLELWDQYYNRRPDGTWSNFLEAFQVITCMDEAERPTVEEDDAAVERYLEVAPRFAPNTTGSYFCTFFPPAEDPRIEITGAGAGPIVVIGTTGDPATPLSSTRVMADTLEDGRLIIVTADKHTGYGENDCVDDAVHRYLIDLVPPEDELQC